MVTLIRRAQEKPGAQLVLYLFLWDAIRKQRIRLKTLEIPYIRP